MVELSGESDLFRHRFDNSVFIIPTIIILGLAAFFGYKLIKSLVDKQKKREEKIKAKQAKKKGKTN